MIGKIIEKFEKRGYKLIAMKMHQPSKGQLETHYKNLKEKPFFKDMIKKTGPCACMIFEGKDVVATGRKIIG